MRERVSYRWLPASGWDWRPQRLMLISTYQLQREHCPSEKKGDLPGGTAPSSTDLLHLIHISDDRNHQWSSHSRGRQEYRRAPSEATRTGPETVGMTEAIRPGGRCSLYPLLLYQSIPRS